MFLWGFSNSRLFEKRKLAFSKSDGSPSEADLNLLGEGLLVFRHGHKKDADIVPVCVVVLLQVVQGSFISDNWRWYRVALL